MKAVILAGGEGTRLRPLSGLRPKPMVRLFDRPVLEHIILLLRGHGITELILTLQAMPKSIIDYFGDGSQLGIKIDYMIEESPLGTAGAVGACRGFLTDDDFLVMSGDAVCDLDLSSCIEAHRAKKAVATLVLHRQKELLEYGLVLTDRNGKVGRFVEKPAWNQVFADTVNTGIYVLRREVLDKIPQNCFYDFAHDLFPVMLKGNEEIFGVTPDGYWCDMGDTEAYRRCCFDALDGRVSLALDAPQLRPGVYIGSGIPESTEIVAPCYIGADVKLGSGCKIGPYAVISSGSILGAGGTIEHSIIDGAHLADRVTLDGAIVARGSVIRDGAILREASVVGEEALIGRHTVLRENARIWPRKEVDDDLQVGGNVAVGSGRHYAFFDEGKLSGEPNVELSPDFCFRLGAAAYNMVKGDIAIGHGGGTAAQICAQAVEVGVRTAGGNTVLIDSSFAASAAYGAKIEGFALTIFTSQHNGYVTLHWLDSNGLPLAHSVCRKLEAAAMRGETILVPAFGIGKSRAAGDIRNRHVLGAVEDSGAIPGADIIPLSVSIPGTDEVSIALRSVAGLLGCEVRSIPGVPVFLPEPNGYTFEAKDESGNVITHGRLLGILCQLEGEKTDKIAVSYNAPAALDHLGQVMNMRVLRLGRDGDDARELYGKQVFMRDALFACARIFRHMHTKNITLEQLNKRLPPFVMRTAEVRITGDRGKVMRMLAENMNGTELYEGLRAQLGKGWIHVSPLINKRSLRIIAEAVSIEAASELCDTFIDKAKRLDKIQ